MILLQYADGHFLATGVIRLSSVRASFLHNVIQSSIVSGRKGF